MNFLPKSFPLKKIVRRTIASFSFFLCLLSAINAHPPYDEWPQAGLNLEWQELMNWSPAIPFNNLFKIADPFSGADTYDSNGYPLTGLPAQTVVYIGENLPTGTYTLKWDGEGDFNLIAGQYHTFSGPCPEDGVSIEISNSSTYIELVINATSKEDHLRNMRFYLPGYDDDSPHQFNDCFLSTFKSPFDLIRPMWWARVPDSDIVNWEDRPTTDQFTYGGDTDDNKGTAWEHMIDICNITDSDLWIGVPVMANNDFVTQLATLIKNRLNPELNIFVEYSNESPWHYWYEYHNGVDPSHLQLQDYPGDDRDIYAAHKYAARASEVLQIFDDIFMDESDRLIGVLGAQYGWTAILEIQIDVIDWLNRMHLFDAFSPGPYISNHAPITTHWPDMDAVFDSLDVYVQGIMDGTVLPGPPGDKGDSFTDFLSLAETYNKKLVAYEAGQHFTSWNPDLTEEQVTLVNLHPRMYDWYQYFTTGWFDHAPTTSTLVFYTSHTPCPGGGSCFGMKTACDQPLDESHKYRAVADLLAATDIEIDQPDKNQKGNMVIYPNPSDKGKIYIDANNNFIKNITITDLSGRVVKIHEVQDNTGVYTLEVDGLRGVYIVLIETPEEVIEKKLTILE